MDIKIRQKLWQAGKTDFSYDRETWFEIIDALMEEFEKFTGFFFQRRNNPAFWEMEYPSSPSFVVGISSLDPEYQRGNIMSPTWLDLVDNDSIDIQFKNSVPLIKCTGSICGDVVEIAREDNTHHKIFFPHIILIVFDSVSKKHLILNSGETTLKFGFECKSNNDSQWFSFGWCHKEPGDRDYIRLRQIKDRLSLIFQRSS